MKIASHNAPGSWQQSLLGLISPPDVAVGGLIYNIMEFIVAYAPFRLYYVYKSDE